MERNTTIIRTSILGIVVNIILVIFKAVVGFIANSIAIILDAVNNLSDALSSIITIIGAKLSGKAPDKDHPYGHGRIEYIASTIIAVIVLAAGIAALKESFGKIITPETANYTAPTLIVVIAGIMVKFALGSYVRNVGNKINSKSLVASGTDAFMDAVISFSTLIAAGISIIWKLNLEGYFGLVISIFIIKAGIEILKDTLSSMIGERIEGELAESIKKRVSEYKEVEGAYDLIIHDYGPSKKMGSIHIQVNDNMTAKEIHKLTRDIQLKLLSEFGIVMTIGIYASNDSDKEAVKIKKELDDIIEEYPEIIQLHGFYIDDETKTIMFDLIISFSCKDRNALRDQVVERIKKEFPKYNYMAIIDDDFSD